MIDTSIDFSLLPEMRARLADIERPFVTFAGIRTANNQPVYGVNLLAMKDALPAGTFTDYLKAGQELRRLEKQGAAQ